MRSKFDAIVQTLRTAVAEFIKDDCLSSGAAIAFYTIFSFPPLVIIVLNLATAAGYSVDQVNQVMQSQVGIGLADVSAGAKSEADSSPFELGTTSLTAKIVGLGILLFSAGGVFGQLQFSLDKVWEVAPDPRQGGIMSFLTKRLLSMGMILVVGFLLLVSLLLTTIIEELLRFIQGTPLGNLGAVFGVLATQVASLAVASLLFAGMFKVLPDAKLGWNDVWVGSMFTAVLFVAGKTIFAWYITASSVSANWADSAASVVVTLTWVYYSSLLVLFGAEVTQAWVQQLGRQVHPEEGAQAVKLVEVKA